MTAAALVEALEREIAALKSAPADDAALVEAMAVEIAKEQIISFSAASATYTVDCSKIARAALAAITPHIRALLAAERKKALEEAARVVRNWSLPTVQAPSMWLIDKEGIAAAIRALTERETQ